MGKKRNTLLKDLLHFAKLYKINIHTEIICLYIPDNTITQDTLTIMLL